MLQATASGLLGPVIALNAWTLAMEVWMYAVNIPVMQKLNLQNTITKSQLDAQTPAPARWKRDNYNHLMEQPTQFYALSLTLAIARGGQVEDMDVLLAWMYTGTRILHSLVHVTSNTLMVRFSLFAFSSGLLAIMTARAAALVFL
ncbi:hypothetical protein N7474_011116 [Penicillium riverlandense]|uniref:uncharacterized protein n=1 Tax=Penicillium riverlandense TaxID=1903569 RepID=UPI002546FED5|nr:uncharacterized protein N7474_011116 [Penicillium riverlandense]KAJ5805229.1 hypothetical protein N7474_011116 [Penicillium riverlandense]